MSLLIREADTGDETAITLIAKAGFEESGTYRAQSYGWMMRNSEAIMLVADEDGRAVGFTSGVLERDAFHLIQVAVLEDNRNKGVALTLTDRLVSVAHERFGCRLFYAEVAQSNAASAKSLVNAGFSVEGDTGERYPNGECAFRYSLSLDEG